MFSGLASVEIGVSGTEELKTVMLNTSPKKKIRKIKPFRDQKVHLAICAGSLVGIFFPALPDSLLLSPRGFRKTDGTDSIFEATGTHHSATVSVAFDTLPSWTAHYHPIPSSLKAGPANLTGN